MAASCVASRNASIRRSSMSSALQPPRWSTRPLPFPSITSSMSSSMKRSPLRSSNPPRMPWEGEEADPIAAIHRPHPLLQQAKRSVGVIDVPMDEGRGEPAVQHLDDRQDRLVVVEPSLPGALDAEDAARPVHHGHTSTSSWFQARRQRVQTCAGCSAAVPTSQPVRTTSPPPAASRCHSSACPRSPAPGPCPCRADTHSDGRRVVHRRLPLG